MSSVALVGCSGSLGMLLEAALGQEGHDSYQVPLDSETPTSLSRVRFDVILLDGHPFTNLGALVGALREHPATAHVPVVVLTAVERSDLDSFEHVEQLSMPFDIEELLATIDRLTP